jgi:hypothetical protein
MVSRMVGFEHRLHDSWVLILNHLLFLKYSCQKAKVGSAGGREREPSCQEHEIIPDQVNNEMIDSRKTSDLALEAWV